MIIARKNISFIQAKILASFKINAVDSNKLELKSRSKILCETLKKL